MKKKDLTKLHFQVIAVGNGWMVKSNLAKKFLVFCDSKRDAMRVARSVAKRRKTNISVHPKKGKIVTIKDYAA